MPGMDYKNVSSKMTRPRGDSMPEQEIRIDEQLFTREEAMGAIRLISLAMGRDGGVFLDPCESQAVSRILDEALVSLISSSESRPGLS